MKTTKNIFIKNIFAKNIFIVTLLFVITACTSTQSDFPSIPNGVQIGGTESFSKPLKGVWLWETLTEGEDQVKQYGFFQFEENNHSIKGVSFVELPVEALPGKAANPQVTRVALSIPLEGKRKLIDGKDTLEFTLDNSDDGYRTVSKAYIIQGNNEIFGKSKQEYIDSPNKSFTYNWKAAKFNAKATNSN